MPIAQIAPTPEPAPELTGDPRCGTTAMPRGAGSAPMVGHGSVHPASRGVNRRLGSVDLGYKSGMPGALPLPSMAPLQGSTHSLPPKFMEALRRYMLEACIRWGL